ncbi:MAG: hypothetical protein Q9220_003634 [cf. Caloplaca sp. 1 TL-2023]
MAHLSEGYNKDQMFKVIRLDSMVLIIPRKFVEELRSLPEHQLSLRHLQAHNLYGKSTTTDILLKSDLHAKVLRTRLTPNLSDYVTSSVREIEYAVEHEFAACQAEGWKSININHALLFTVAAVTSRAISGDQLCRIRRWLSTCTRYTENIFITVLILRLFPRSCHRWISAFLPSSWITHLSLRRAKKMLIPIIQERQRQQAAPTKEYEKPTDLLQYMIESAHGDDLEPGRLAHLQLMVNLAGIHTTSAAMTHAIYDLCEHPESVECLREEIEQVLQQDGGWQRNTYKKLDKLDSFLKESQRFNPPTLLSFNRIALAPLSLSSGISIPAGTHFSVASRHILFDPEVTPDPLTFDAFRYHKLRKFSPDGGHTHDFASADGTNMNFGAGRYACPGRYFAAMELKLLLAHLLLNYDFRFPDGVSRPGNLVIDEFAGPNPWAKVLVRKRSKEKNNLE